MYIIVKQKYPSDREQTKFYYVFSMLLLIRYFDIPEVFLTPQVKVVVDKELGRKEWINFSALNNRILINICGLYMLFFVALGFEKFKSITLNGHTQIP